MAKLDHHRLAPTVLSDPGIPTLEAVLDPVAMERYLQEVLPDLWEAIENVEFEVLKHHPGSRCTFETTLHTRSGRRSLIGKVYAADRSELYLALSAIRRAGFGPEDEFSIPEPIAYIPHLRLLFQEKVEGPRAKQVFLKGDERDRVEASERCGRWLARFQTLAPVAGRVSRLEAELDSLEDWSLSLAESGRPFADEATRLCRDLRAAARGIGTVELSAGHGHYGCGHIVLAQGRTVTIDWDTLDVADPCRDAARFLVELKRLGLKYLGSMRALDQAADGFLTTYLSLCRPEVRGRLPLFAATMCLHQAKKDISHEADRWSEKAAATLDEGLRLLAQGVVLVATMCLRLANKDILDEADRWSEIDLWSEMAAAALDEGLRLLAQWC